MTIKTLLHGMGILLIELLIGAVYLLRPTTITRVESARPESSSRVENVSPVVETPINIEGKNIPSVCDARNWSIAYVDGMYYERLPGGSIWSLEAYPTREACQQDIDKAAAWYMAQFRKFGNL